jgi:transposase
MKRFVAKIQTIEKKTNRLQKYNIGMGDWQASNNSCISAPKVPNQKFVSMLCRKNSTVRFIDEFNTSKKCADCFEDLKKYDQIKREAVDSTSYSKLRYCKKCQHVIHRDQNGSRNIEFLHAFHLNKQGRPEQFCRAHNVNKSK